MKLYKILTISCFCILIVGCQGEKKENPDNQMIYSELINSFNDIQTENAIISQHTLFPYHFVKNGAELNELGQRDCDILAKHFADHPGQLNIRRNSISEDLYEARIQTVIDNFKEAGVKTEQVSISDGMPGGSGMASEKVLIILEKEQEDTPSKTMMEY